MNDGKVSLTSTLAWATWALSGIVVIACLIIYNRAAPTSGGMVLCTVAIIIAAAAATLHVRAFFCRFAREYENAYRIGVDVGHLEAASTLPLQRIPR